MGQGYYFQFHDVVKARRAMNTFYSLVYRRYRRKCHTLGITRSSAGLYVSGVDVCGPHSDKIDKLQQEVIDRVQSGL